MRPARQPIRPAPLSDLIHRMLLLFVILSVFHFPQTAVCMAQDAPDNEESKVAAQIALLALRTALPKGEPIAEVQRLIVLPGDSPLTIDQAVDSLMRMSKPRFCTATSRDGILVINCKVLRESPKAASTRRREAAEWLETVRRRFPSPYSTRDIVVRGSGGAVLASWSDIATWFDEYVTATGGVGVMEADLEARALGATIVLELWGPPSGVGSIPL